MFVRSILRMFLCVLYTHGDDDDDDVCRWVHSAVKILSISCDSVEMPDLTRRCRL